MTRTNSQNGSVFILIMLAIAMFAWLSYALMQGSRTSQATLTKEQAKLAAQELVSYTDVIVKAVHRLRLSGCSDTQIGFSFTDQPLWWANNPFSPADNSCQVFSINGGKVSFSVLNESWFAVPTSTPYGYPNGEIVIKGIGTTAPELLFAISDLKWPICEEINKMLSISPGTFQEVMTTPTGNFAGTYVPLPNGIGDDVGSPFVGKSSACAMNVVNNGTYVVTLIAR